MQTDEIFIASLKVTNMVSFLELKGTEIHDTIKMCLWYIENKTMAREKKGISSISQEKRNIKYTFDAHLAPLMISVNKGKDRKSV